MPKSWLNYPIARAGTRLSHYRSGGTARAKALVRKLMTQEAMKRKADDATPA